VPGAVQAVLARRRPNTRTPRQSPYSICARRADARASISLRWSDNRDRRAPLPYSLSDCALYHPLMRPLKMTPLDGEFLAPSARYRPILGCFSRPERQTGFPSWRRFNSPHFSSPRSLFFRHFPETLSAFSLPLVPFASELARRAAQYSLDHTPAFPPPAGLSLFPDWSVASARRALSPAD